MFFTKEYWSAVLSKFVETLISVKLWIILIATFFAYKMLNICIEIKDVAIQLSQEPNPSNELVETLARWNSSILDTTLAMFTGVIVVITISREAFKHARINKDEFKENSTQTKTKSKSSNKSNQLLFEKIKNRMV